jgi:hypothetical protein
MKSILGFVLAVCIPSLASAELLVYKSSEKSKFTGGGRETTYSYTGFWVLDLSNTNVMRIHAWTASGRKFYSVGSPTFHWTALFGNNRTYFALNLGNVSTDPTYRWRAAFVKGQCQTLITSDTASAFYPRTMSGSWLELTPNPSNQNDTGLSDVTLTFSFQKPMTVESNNAGETAQALIDRLSSIFESQGYQRAS